jgi:hypothetical protein
MSSTDFGNLRNVNKSFLSKPCVRYVGFQSIPDGRRLIFSIRRRGEPATEVACEVRDKDFRDTLGLSIQDAAPMAYEKIVAILATEHRIEPRIVLTEADTANYIIRHTPVKVGRSKNTETGVAA